MNEVSAVLGQWVMATNRDPLPALSQPIMIMIMILMTTMTVMADRILTLSLDIGPCRRAEDA